MHVIVVITPSKPIIENRRPDELILFADELDIDLLPKVG